MIYRVCSVPITRQVLFPVFHSFPLFSFESFESPWLVTYFRMCWGMPFSISTFSSSSFLPIFPSGRNPILPIWKLPVAIPLFVLLHSGSPRRFPLAPLEVVGYFLYFLLGLLVLVASALFLIFFSCPFLSNCLNLPLTVLMHLEGSVPPGGCWGSWLFFFNLLPWVSFPS